MVCKENFKGIDIFCGTSKVQEPCNHCGKSIREQSQSGCLEITCYRQFLKNNHKNN